MRNGGLEGKQAYRQLRGQSKTAAPAPMSWGRGSLTAEDKVGWIAWYRYTRDLRGGSGWIGKENGRLGHPIMISIMQILMLPLILRSLSLGIAGSRQNMWAGNNPS